MKQDYANKERSEIHTQPHRQALDIMPETAGPRLATSRGGVIHSIRPPGEQTVQIGTHLALVTLAPATGNRASLGSDKLQEYDAQVGALVVLPADVEGRAIWSRTRETVIIALEPNILVELAAGEFDVGSVSLQPPDFGTVDREALRIAHLLRAELTRQQPPNALYVDSLTTHFGVHLLRNYSGVTKPSRPPGGLSSHNARRVQEFLSENFTRKLSVREIATVAGLSPFHFIRAFSKTFGQPPHQYVFNLRLAFAEKLLTKGDISISEIAYLSGFSSQSHLAAAMRKHRQATPDSIRRSKRKHL